MGSFKVDVDDVVPLLLGDVEDGLAGDVARRVDQHVDVTEGIENGVAQVHEVPANRDVAGHLDGLGASLPELRRRPFDAVLDREVATTSAPSSAKPSAMARPIPLVAPTATTVLPSAR